MNFFITGLIYESTKLDSGEPYRRKMLATTMFFGFIFFLFTLWKSFYEPVIRPIVRALLIVEWFRFYFTKYFENDKNYQYGRMVDLKKRFEDDLKENPKYKTIYGWFLNKVQKPMFIRFVEKVEKLRHDKSIKMS